MSQASREVARDPGGAWSHPMVHQELSPTAPSQSLVSSAVKCGYAIPRWPNLMGGREGKDVNYIDIGNHDNGHNY